LIDLLPRPLYLGRHGQMMSFAPPIAADERFTLRTYAKVTWRLIPFLFLCYILAYLDRVNVGFAKLQMLADLHLSDDVFGYGAGIFFIGYFIFEVPSNIILKQVGARIWIARIMVTWGIISAAMMFARSQWVFYTLRFLLGFAEAGFFPGIIYYLTIWYPSRQRARMTAWFMTGIALAGAIGSPMSGSIMHALNGWLGLAGWKWLFVLEGLPSVVVGVWVLLYLDSSIDEARWLSDQEKALLKRNIALDDQHKQHARVSDAFASPRVWLLCGVYFCMMIGLYGVGFWLPTLVEGGLGLKNRYLAIGLVSAIPYGVAAVGMILVGRSSDLTGERRWHTALSSFVGALGLVLSGVLSHHPWLAIAGLSLGTLGILSAPPLFWTLPTSFLAGTAAAAGIGIINSVGNLGGFVGPNIPVWIKKTISKDPSAPLYAIAACLCVGALLILLFISPEMAKRRDAK
jgi:D-galactonate transporter